MKQLNRNTANVHQNYPERILQFGGGNFLRGFVDWIVHKYNQQSTHEKLGILAVKVRAGGSYQKWKDQEGLFHLFTKGYKNGKTIDEKSLITSVVRIIEAHQEWKDYLASATQPKLNIIVSNTTESGITFDQEDNKNDIPSNFPGQLTAWLYQRFTHFKGNPKAGCTLIPCELITDNGQLLKSKVLEYANHWKLENEFINWLDESCTFCNSLVDRIVTGVKEENFQSYCERLGYNDVMMTEGEPYHLWAIEDDGLVSAKLPLDRIGLNVIFTKDLSEFRERKLKILNGAHTSMVPIGLLLGIKTVGEFLDDSTLKAFLKNLIFDEIIPSILLDKKSCSNFANEVLDRFRNPFLEHQLESISLYSISKFNNRIKPTLKEYIKQNRHLPDRISLVLSCLLVFYKGAFDDKVFNLNDEKDKIDLLKNHWQNSDGNTISLGTVRNMLSDKLLWEEDLNDLPGLTEKTHSLISEILNGNLKSLIN